VKGEKGFDKSIVDKRLDNQMLVHCMICYFKSVDVLKHRLVMLLIDFVSFPKLIKFILTIVINISNIIGRGFNCSFQT